jgi:FAD/FMN-containing dehydrogenase
MAIQRSADRRGGIAEGALFGARVDGQLLRPGDSGYGSARRVFNAMIDRRPALIIRCASARDATAGVLFAAVNGLPLSVKGGGHGVAGDAVCDGGVMLDLSQMRAIHIDPVRRVATAQPGLTLGELDRATQAFGLATPTGIMSGTGLSGLTLGGGLGWLSGKYGLTCDNLLAAEVITADGRRITTSANEHQDLFWGLRGAGANFGVVTSFTFRLHPVATVLAGVLTYPPHKARAALRLYDEFAAGCRDELSVNGSVAKSPDGEVEVSIMACYTGDVMETGDRLLQPLRSLGPVDNTVAPIPYKTLQHLPDDSFPVGQQHYWKSGSVTYLADGLIDVLIDFVERMPSTASGVGLQQLHGAAARLDSAATAYPHRCDRYDLLILSQWRDPAESEQNIRWTQDLFGAIEPHLSGGVYVNNLGADDKARVARAYGSNHDRLVSLKTAYDPTNLFAGNHNIRPLSTMAR